jgi:hypothetical protein
MEKKPIKKQSYTIEVTTYDDGSIASERTNDGFSAIELLGLLYHVSLDIQLQMSGNIQPTIVKRNYVEQSNLG